MGSNDNDLEDPSIRVAAEDVENDKNLKIAESSLLGFVANTLNTSAAWSRRQNLQQNYTKPPKDFYNYATRGSSSTNHKTAMCRIAEIARFNKLKHEYILMDENGPAHMKYFTVKLVLCPEEEYLGEGASIKKAQEAAADVALKHTTLKAPPPRSRNKPDMEPVTLLNQVAYQLNLSVDYECESISVPIKLQNPSSSTGNSVKLSSTTTAATGKPQNAFGQPSILPYSGGVSPPFPVGSFPPPSLPLFCSNVSLPLPPASTANVFAFNSGLLVSPPPVMATPQQQQQRPLETIQSMLYQRILNCNNTTKNNYSLLPHQSAITEHRDLHTNHSLQQHTIAARATSSMNCFSIPNVLTPMNPQSLGSGWAQKPKKLNSSAISSSIPPLFLLPPLLPPFPPNPISSGAAVSPISAPILNAGDKPKFGPPMTKLLPLPPLTPHPILNDVQNKTNAMSNCGDSKTENLSKKTLRVFRVTLKLGDGTKHLGVGADRPTAKSNAAIQTLKYLRPLLESLQEEITKNENSPLVKSPILKDKNANSSEELPEELDNKLAITNDAEAKPADSDAKMSEKENVSQEKEPDTDVETPEKPNPKKKKKSIISLIHECAIQLRMDVEFENVSVTGEAHNREFTVRCRFVSPRTAQIIEADGKGTSKKWAKQNACQLIYDKIKGLEKDPVYLANLVVKKARKPACPYQAKTAKRKILMKQRRSDPQYGQWVNPVCRLMQVMQSNGKPDPVFKFLGEHGHCKFKEFVMQVTCMDKVAEGRSQNKRLAKRAAADEMLRMLGYAKEMPQPGKSLLKKNAMTMDIGSFDAGELSSSPDDNDSEKSCGLPEDSPDFIYKTPIPELFGTFAEVDEMMKLNNKEPVVVSGWDALNGDKPPVPALANPPANSPDGSLVRAESSSPISAHRGEDGSAMPVRKRRVTFNNQVSACPPPDDANYPEASVAPLKSEVLFVGSRLRKRGRDSKKMLTIEEKQVLSSVTSIFLKHRSQVEPHNLPDPNVEMAHSMEISIDFKSPNGLQTAKDFLDLIAKTHKFSVIYSDFPKTEQCFSLVTLGIDKPIVCPGSGNTEDEAHEDAALNAIKELSKLNMTT